jgi:hypothetical protein
MLISTSEVLLEKITITTNTKEGVLSFDIILPCQEGVKASFGVGRQGTRDGSYEPDAN